MGHEFMEGVWERVKRLEQAEALLRKEPSSPCRKAGMKRPVFAAATVALALMLVAFTPSLAAKYQEWLRGPQSVYLEQDETVVDQGIEVHTLAGFNDASTVELLFTVRDLEGDRLGGDLVDMDLEWEGKTPDDDWGMTRLFGLHYLEYDGQERSWLLRAELNTSEVVDFEGLFMKITEMKPIRKTDSSFYRLSELPLDTWLAAPGEGLPEDLGITVYTSEWTEEGLTLTASLPPKGRNVDIRLVGKDGSDLAQSVSKDGGVQYITFPDVTEADAGRDMGLRMDYWYASETISGDWNLPVRTKPVEERVVKPKGGTVDGAPVREVALSNAMARMIVEQPTPEDREAVFPNTDAYELRLHLKDGTTYATDHITHLDWESGSGRTQHVFKWILEERIDPEQVEQIEAFGSVIPIE